MSIDPAAREIPAKRPCRFKYSICALVNNHSEYAEMMESFIQAGFTTADCEFLYIDNSQGNKAEAFAGYNRFLDAAEGEFVILCHQDILLKFDNRKILEERLGELDKMDPNWGLAGNAGGVVPGVNAVHISHPGGEQNTKNFPAQVRSLDENFIIVKKEANLCLSHDLQGFHFYGMDICQAARMLGWNAWAVDFHLFHKSEGNFGEPFYEMSRAVSKKYARALEGGMVQTMGTRLYISGSPFKNWLWTPSRRLLTFEQKYGDQKKLKKGERLNKAPEFLAQPLGPGWTAFYWVAHKIRVPIENFFSAIAKRRRASAHQNHAAR